MATKNKELKEELIKIDTETVRLFNERDIKKSELNDINLQLSEFARKKIDEREKIDLDESIPLSLKFSHWTKKEKELNDWRVKAVHALKMKIRENNLIKAESRRLFLEGNIVRNNLGMELVSIISPTKCETD